MTSINKVMEVINDPNYTNLIGVGLSVTGNILISIALNVQKYAHNRIQARIKSDEEERLLPEDGSNIELQNLSKKPKNKNYLKSRFWWVGFILMFVGEIGNFLAYGFAPASAIAPLGTVGLVSNAIIAPLLLGEHFRRQDFLGIILAMGGATSVVLTSKNSESQIPPEDFYNYFLKAKVLIYVGVCISLMTAFISISDTYGGFTVLSTKAVSYLLSTTNVEMFLHGFTYLLLFVLISTAVLQIKYLNKALQRFDSTVVIPTQFVLFTLSAVIGSAILYDDFDTFTAEQYVTFTLGCLLTFTGVFCIASGREDDSIDIENSDSHAPFVTRSRSSSSASYHSYLGNSLNEGFPISNSRPTFNRQITTASAQHCTGLSSLGLSYSYGSAYEMGDESPLA